MTDRVLDLDRAASPSRLRKFSIFLAVWSAIVIIEGLVIRAQSRVPIPYAILNKVVDYTPLAIASLLLWRMTAATARWRTSAKVALHLAVGIPTVLLWKSLYLLWLRFTIGPAYWRIIFAESWMYQLVNSYLTYFAMLSVILVLQGAKRERERERRDAELALTARDAELAALRAQLHPHLILNSLNSILALVTIDPERAREMIVGLARLLHAAFNGVDSEEVPLSTEIALVRNYLAIEQIRFAERLAVSIDVEANANDVPVPPLLLQPIVENAIKHGIGPHTRPGTVRVKAWRTGNPACPPERETKDRDRQDCLSSRRLLIEVRDSGEGMVDGALQNGGRGLALTRRRLDSIYRSDYTLSFERGGGEFIVRLDLPAAVDA
jgi:signal transduction histidine kinase